MKKIFLMFVLPCIAITKLVADEGMWLPMLIDRLNYVDMQKMGLNLTAEEIYSVNHSSIKDAIVSLNNGMCTAFMVSKDGLMMTNHHCGLEYITENSIKYNNDFLQNGFWAADKKLELYNPNLTATFLVRIEDVSKKVIEQLPDNMNEDLRKQKIKEISSEICSKATLGTHYDAEVKSFFRGNEFYLFVYETYSDVRLVGAPPMPIAAFGADADNWKWPRQNADFAFFRIYSAPDGKPNVYDKRRNIPLTPKYFLTISSKGANEGDFNMVLGYPGHTDRNMTSGGLNMTLETINPSIVNIRENKLRILKEEMDKDPTIMIMYRSKYNRSSNYWKYYIGQTEVLKRLKAVEKAINTEKEFSKKTKNSSIVSDINKAYGDVAKYRKALVFYNECVFRGPEIFSFANKFDSLLFYMKHSDIPEPLKAAKIADISTKLKYYASNYYFNSYKLDVDKKLFISLLRLMKDNIEDDFQPSIFEEITKKYKDNFAIFADSLYEKSIFASKEKTYDFLRNPNVEALENDIAFKANLSINEKYTQTKKETNDFNNKIEKGERQYLSRLIKINPTKKWYPDANNTMRLTYGKISKYTPTDGAEEPFYTTLSDMIKREESGNPDFYIPSKLKELYSKKDFESYTNQKGELPICFLSDCDVTGGNSGAPVLNSNGEVVGIVFDINWEATASSLSYVPKQTRTISTDIRYILFIVDKYAEANNILQELKIK